MFVEARRGSWVLMRTEFGSFAKSASALHRWAISLVPGQTILPFVQLSLSGHMNKTESDWLVPSQNFVETDTISRPLSSDIKLIFRRGWLFKPRWEDHWKTRSFLLHHAPQKCVIGAAGWWMVDPRGAEHQKKQPL